MDINYSDLEMAFEFASSGYEFDHSAWLNKVTGQIYYISDASEDVLPEDIDDSENYLEIPDKREFGLGKPLAIEFSRTHLSSDIDKIYSIFQSKGAYSRFKDLLEERESLDKWYKFEQEALKASIIQWSNDNGVKFSI